ncbi:MAG: phage tail protein [Pontixanthobacter sp.]
MATLVLGTLGSVIGGPIGGVIGTIAGGGGRGREGPRLKELALTTSSYGTPIARLYGRMRVPGTMIWATDLQESSERSGGKGQPKTTTYSYSSSFAVALSSRPIAGIGRIWADGNLLRGAAGDLKVGGALRIHKGFGDQPIDPLIAADLGERGCPAFRGRAYVVFEDLQLADFGNRIPALTFEVIADAAEPDLAMFMADRPDNHIDAAMDLPGLYGFADEGGPLADTLAIIDSLFPVAIDHVGTALTLRPEDRQTNGLVTLPDAVVSADDNDFGSMDGQQRERRVEPATLLQSLRYYDIARDYQPGVQRAIGRAVGSMGTAIEFPGALAADTAVALLDKAHARSRWAGDRLQWRIGTIDPRIRPGAHVRLPASEHSEANDIWMIEEWEWRENGIELALRRSAPNITSDRTGDSGDVLPPIDEDIGPTVLRIVELPWDGVGSSSVRRIYMAAGSPSPAWKGATLYHSEPNGLVPIEPTGRSSAAIGSLNATLPPGSGVVFEADARIFMALATAHMGFGNASWRDLALGANRLLIGGEIVQFARSRQLSPDVWELTGLLRGRGGTEHLAVREHPIGTPCILLDEHIRVIDTANIPVGLDTQFAAIGLADEEPVRQRIANLGASLQPLSPVHGRSAYLDDGLLHLRWTRRARGGWDWSDAVDAPRQEESEAYEIGTGNPDVDVARWQSGVPELTIGVADISANDLWVRQIGRFGRSPPLRIALPA